MAGNGAGSPEAVLVRFSRAVDMRQPKEVAELFAEDGLFRPGNRDIRGRADILAHYLIRLANPRRVTRHIWANVDCEHVDDGEARIDAILYTHAFEPSVSEKELQIRMGDVRARCVFEAGLWRFAEHIYTRTFTTSAPMTAAPLTMPGPAVES